MSEPIHKLRVVIGTPFGPKGRGGMDRLTDLIVETLKSRPDLAIEAVSLTTRGQRGLVIGFFVFVHAVARFSLALRFGNVDLLHLNVAAGGSVYRKLILAKLARASGVPYVVHLHGSRFREFWASASPRSRRAIEMLFVESKHIIVLGQSWEQLVSDHLPEVKCKITILRNATKSAAKSAANLAINNGAPVQVTFLGQLGERKGIFSLIEALGRLGSKGNWRATLGGDGEVEKCRALIADLGIANKVNIPGWIDGVGVDGILQQTDVFVLPSTAENLPMAIIEAFAYGIPVVATPVGAIPEMVHHERNGFIVPVGDADALAATLGRLIEDKGLRSSLGNAARLDHQQHYDINIYINKLAVLWRGIVTGTKLHQ